MTDIAKTTTINGWAIHETASVDAGVYTTHLACKGNRGGRGQNPSFTVGPHSASYTVSDDHPVCWYCNVLVPDEIQALLILRTGGV
jgi:hypothetical protein